MVTGKRRLPFFGGNYYREIRLVRSGSLFAAFNEIAGSVPILHGLLDKSIKLPEKTFKRRFHNAFLKPN